MKQIVINSIVQKFACVISPRAYGVYVSVNDVHLSALNVLFIEPSAIYNYKIIFFAQWITKYIMCS